MLVNVYVLCLNTRIQQFIIPRTIVIVILTMWSHTSQVLGNVSTRGDKHTIHDYRRATCHCRMCTLHPKKTGVAQIARSDPVEMRSRFPVAPVNNNQYGRADLLMRLYDPITSNTAAYHRMIRKLFVFNWFTRCLLDLDTPPSISRSTNRTRTVYRCSIARFKSQDTTPKNK